MEAALSPVVIEFHGDELLAVEKDGEQYVAMRPIVEALGMDWSRQCRKIKADSSCGHMSTPLETKGGVQQAVCIPLRKLNGWLFCVNVNRVREDLREKVRQYREECFSALYAHFHGEGTAALPAVSSEPPRARAYPTDLQNRVYHRGKAVLASSSLAVFFETDAKTLSNLKRGPRGLFVEGAHFFDIKGAEVERFYELAKEVPLCILPPGVPGNGLTLFTDEGAKYLALSLGSKAQDVYLHLRRTYYAPEPDTWEGPTGCLDSAMRRAEKMLVEVRRILGQSEELQRALTR